MKLKNRTVKDDGTVVFTEKGILEFLYSGGKLENIVTEENNEDIELYNHYITAHNTEYHPIKIFSGNETISTDIKWFIPDDVAGIDILEYCTSLCSTEEEILRVQEEFSIYKKLDLENLLRLMIHIVSVLRKNKLVWAGRGSSVCSYILYLIGVHHVNPIKYKLSIHEFLKDQMD